MFHCLIGLTAFAWLAAVWPVLLPLENLVVDQDWVRDIAKFESARRTVLEHGQVPLRTLQLGAGYPLASHPLDGSHHPLFLLVLLVGARITMKVTVATGLAVAVLGGYYLGRRVLGLLPMGSLWLAATFGLSGWLSTQLRSGNWPEIYMLGLPLLLGLMVDRERGRRSLLPAIFLALFIGLQSAYRMPLVVLWCLIFQLVHGAAEARAGGPGALGSRFMNIIRQYAGLTLGVALIGLPRWVLAIEALQDNLRTIPVYPAEESQGLLVQLAQHGIPDFREPDHLAPEWLWSAFVGPLGLALGCIGLFVGLRTPRPGQRNLRPTALAAIVLGVGASWLSAAHHAPVDLWRPLSSLPGFAAMFQPAKYFPLAACLSLAVGGALLIHRGEEALQVSGMSRRLSMTIPLLLAVQLGTLGWHAHHQHDRAFGPPPVVSLPSEPGPYGFAGQRRISHEVLGWFPDSFIFQAAAAVEQGRAISPWIDPLRLSGSEGAPAVLLEGGGQSRPADGYQGEAWLHHSQGHAAILEWTPGRVRLQADTTANDIILLNQRWSPHLVAERGSVLDYEGFVAVPVPQGRTEVTLWYRNRNYHRSIPIGFLSLVAFVWFGLRRRQPAQDRESSA